MTDPALDDSRITGSVSPEILAFLEANQPDPGTSAELPSRSLDGRNRGLMPGTSPLRAADPGAGGRLVNLAPFVTHASRYQMNLTGSANTHARPVTIAGPDGESSGVGIFRNKYLLTILTEQDATRLADQIIDVLEGA